MLIDALITANICMCNNKTVYPNKVAGRKQVNNKSFANKSKLLELEHIKLSYKRVTYRGMKLIPYELYCESLRIIIYTRLLVFHWPFQCNVLFIRRLFKISAFL